MAIFNQTEKFYSYAPHTMFTTYAALCGCIPVVVPQKGVSREAWRPEKDFFGVAYGDGVDQITWARNTRDELLKACDDEKAKQDLMVSNFAERLKVQFS